MKSVSGTIRFLRTHCAGRIRYIYLSLFVFLVVPGHVSATTGDELDTKQSVTTTFEKVSADTPILPPSPEILENTLTLSSCNLMPMYKLLLNGNRAGVGTFDNATFSTKYYFSD